MEMPPEKRKGIKEVIFKKRGLFGPKINSLFPKLRQRKFTLLLILGLVIILAILFITSLIKQQSYQKSISLTPPFILSLNSPVDGEVITSRKIEVKGTTQSNSTVLVYTEDNVNSVESNPDGSFEAEIELSTGLNNLVVTAFKENGQEESIILDIVYDTEGEKVKSAQTEESKGKKPAQPPGQTKKEEPAQPPGQTKKEEPAQPQPQEPEPPKAIVGEVEEVTPESVTVKEKKTKESVETKVDQETVVINQDSQKIKVNNIEPSDAAGIITDTDKSEEDKDLEEEIAAKIYVNQTPELSQSKRQAIQGVITNIQGSLITVTHQIKTDQNFTFLVNQETEIKVKGVVAASIQDLTVGLRVAAVGDPDLEGVLVAKWIHVIPGKTFSISSPLPDISPSITPILSITPVLSPTITSIITPSLTLTPTPTATVSKCTLVSANWSVDSNIVAPETVVGLSVTATGNCLGKTLSFEVKEKDSLIEGGGDDPVEIEPVSLVFSSLWRNLMPIESAWTAEWQSDCLGLCNPPEYYFEVSLTPGSDKLSSADPLLIVELESSPTPSPTPTPIIEEEPTSDKPKTILSDDGTKCFDSDGNYPTNTSYQIKGYCIDNTGVYYDYCDTSVPMSSPPIVEYSCNLHYNPVGVGTSEPYIPPEPEGTYSARCFSTKMICSPSSCGTCIDGALRLDTYTPSPTGIISPTISPFPIGNYPDTSPPIIAIITPEKLSTVSGTVTLEVSATDNADVSKVDFYGTSGSLGTVNQPPYKVSWDTTQEKNNYNYLIWATAYDTSNNSSNVMWSLFVSNPQ